MKISDREDDVLITYALGSCLGIAIYDPVARIGGLLHVMLPLSTIDPAKAAENPFMFVDTGVPRLFMLQSRRQKGEVTGQGGGRSSLKN